MKNKALSALVALLLAVSLSAVVALVVTSEVRDAHAGMTDELPIVYVSEIDVVSSTGGTTGQ